MSRNKFIGPNPSTSHASIVTDKTEIHIYDPNSMYLNIADANVPVAVINKHKRTIIAKRRLVIILWNWYG